MATTTKTSDRDKARERLRQIFPEGASVSGLTMTRSRDRRSRVVAILAHGEGTSVINVSDLVALMLGYPLVQYGQGIRLQGIGVDPLQHLVAGLAGALHGHAQKLKADALR